MDIFQVINNHKSIREYLQKDVEDDVLEEVLQAGLRASSSGNMQTYSVIVTKDMEIKQQLFEPHFQQPMVTEAPVLMTFCADFRRMRHWLRLNQAKDHFDNFMSFMIGAFDAALASQNVALAAEAKGLGICYMGTTLASCDQIGRILKLPKGVFPVVGFSMGYPAESPDLRDRLPLSGMIHQDTYQDYDDERIQEIYRDRDEKGWERYMKFPRLREMIEKSGVENLAQVYSHVKYTQESHQEFSKRVLNYLKEQDFMNQ